MLIILLFLIFFFFLLISYQIINTYFKSSIIEGMLDVVPTISPQFIPTSSPTNEMLPNLTINQVYRQYDKKIADNTFLMAQQNAGNIEYLKQRIDSVQGLYDEVQDISGNVAALQNQMNGLIMAQQQYVSQITDGNSVPNITGTTPSNSSDDTTNLVTS